MKNLIKTIAIGFLVLLACKKEKKNPCDFVIDDGLVTSPQWLMNIADSIEIHNRKNGAAFWDQSMYMAVFPIHHQGKDYILV